MCVCAFVRAYICSVQVVEPTADGKKFDDTDAALKLDLGTPRYFCEQIICGVCFT